MNLRRTFLALGAMILGVGFFGASPASAAQTYFPAANSPCKVYTLAGSTWPTNGHFFLCDGTTSPTGTASVVMNTARNAHASLRGKLDAEKVDVFVFPSPVEVAAYVDFQHSIPLTGLQADDYGATWPSQGQLHPYGAIVLMKKSLNGTVHTNTEMTRATAHELGHGLDMVYNFPSQQANFNNLLAVDIVDFNKVTNPPPNFAGFSSTCLSKPKNMDKLLCHEQNLQAGSVKELFADLYASYQAGTGTLPPEVGVLLQNYFTLGSSQPQVKKYRSRQYVIDLATGARQP